ncbi:hypothetical protein [Amycolatopsis sp. NPDC004079]|uniref:hypothetical protein n=1 Tax=Amycolatopsis sp. NPDC004079 TaxID=3154549 RepID=UPI0033A6F5B5
MSDNLLREQYADLLLRFRSGRLPIDQAIKELVALQQRPDAISDADLHAALTKIAEAHEAGTLRTHSGSTWDGAPTQKVIGDLLGIGKSRGRLSYVRDAYYTLYLRLPPFNPDQPRDDGDQDPNPEVVT